MGAIRPRSNPDSRLSNDDRGNGSGHRHCQRTRLFLGECSGTRGYWPAGYKHDHSYPTCDGYPSAFALSEDWRTEHIWLHSSLEWPSRYYTWYNQLGPRVSAYRYWNSCTYPFHSWEFCDSWCFRGYMVYTGDVGWS